MRKSLKNLPPFKLAVWASYTVKEGKLGADGDPLLELGDRPLDPIAGRSEALPESFHSIRVRQEAVARYNYESKSYSNIMVMWQVIVQAIGQG